MSDHELSPDALRKAAEHFKTNEGAYWPAFYLNWAADEIDRLRAALEIKGTTQ